MANGVYHSVCNDWVLWRLILLWLLVNGSDETDNGCGSHDILLTALHFRIFLPWVIGLKDNTSTDGNSYFEREAATPDSGHSICSITMGCCRSRIGAHQYKRLDIRLCCWLPPSKAESRSTSVARI
ncbi:hypothetical protein C8R45DRAFT_605090 [Mycena sanguinolenta]|nr:hypothetical protein C8R45DRAFT_605090 [Mycena sanguinolenta]